jgi:hypothetical protein
VFGYFMDAFILGAGFSHSLCIEDNGNKNIPLCSGLHDVICAETWDKNGEIRKLFAKYNTNRIDLLFSQLDLDILKAEGSTTKAELERQREYLAGQVRIAISGSPSSAKPLDRPSEASLEFARMVPNGSQLITFNYELLLEKSLWEAKRWAPCQGYAGIEDYGFNGVPRNTNGIKVYKLHGSYNFSEWPRTESEQIFTENFIGQNIANEYFPGVNGIPNARASCEIIGCSKREETLIMPSYYKAYSTQIRKMWWEAFDALEKADRLFIIGYSFPIEDTMSEYLLDSYLRRTGEIKKIYVFDINPPAELARKCGDHAEVVSYKGDFKEQLSILKEKVV